MKKKKHEPTKKCAIHARTHSRAHTFDVLELCNRTKDLSWLAYLQIETARATKRKKRTEIEKSEKERSQQRKKEISRTKKNCTISLELNGR